MRDIESHKREIERLHEKVQRLETLSLMRKRRLQDAEMQL